MRQIKDDLKQREASGIPYLLSEGDLKDKLKLNNASKREALLRRPLEEHYTP